MDRDLCASDSYAPNERLPRHPVRLHELLGDLAVAGILLKPRGRLPQGAAA